MIDGSQGTDPAFDNIEHTQFRLDPILAAYALVAHENGIVETREKLSRSKRIGTPNLPDA